MNASPVNVHVFLPKTGPVTQDELFEYARGETIQVCDAVIEEPAKQIVIRLYLAHPISGPATIDAVPASQSAIHVLVHDDGDSIAAFTRPPDDLYTTQIAAAISVMKAAWAWDERPELRVLVNKTPLVASAARFDGNRRWNVQVEAAV